MLKRMLTLVFALLLAAGAALAQERTITGTVKDAGTGEPLPGANVIIKGTSNGTVTRADGSFRLNVPEETEMLEFSYLGYQKKEVNISGKQQVEISLKQETKGLDEVVVVGYGTVKKSDLTGSVTSVKEEELNKIAGSNPLEALQGKMAGAQISSSSGEPGASPVVRVRGVGTINNASPIYVVDGVIVDDISFLNSNDIESVELLKDASATAIYGSRGANGVFMISTKQGGEGEAQINVRTEYGFQQIEKKLDLLNGEEFARALNDITPGAINNVNAVPNVDYQDLIFRENPIIQNYNISARGGSEEVSFYLGGGVHDTKGIIPKSDYRRYNVKLNTDYQAKDFLKVGANISGAFIDDDNAPNVVGSAYRAWPIDEPYDENGNLTEVRGNGNPVAAIEYSNNNTDRYRMVSNLFAEFTFLEDFKFKTSYQLNYRADRNTSFTPEYFVSPTQQNQRNSLSKSFTENTSWIFENTLNYDKTFNDHHLKVLLGYTAQNNTVESPSVTAYRIIRDDPKFWYLNAATTDTVDVGSYEYETSMESYLFRTNYTYAGKYLLTASLRADGSSKFSDENKYGYFPSFALGWNISKEDFFPETEFVDNLKIRGSWGIIGNEKISWSDRFALIGNQYGAVFGREEALQPGATYQGAGNSNIRWESTRQLNGGLDLTALDGKLNAAMDYYRKTTDDILVYLGVPGYYGVGAFQRVRFNAASVRNSGLEFNAQWQERRGSFRYSLGITGSTVKNEVLSIDANSPVDSVIMGGNLSNGDQVTATYPGSSIGAFFGYKTVGIFQNAGEVENNPSLGNQDEGDLRYKDVDGNGKIDENDRTIIGSPIPDFTYGFNFSVGWKGITLAADFQGQFGNEIYNAKNQTRFGVYNFESRVKDRWSGEGTSTTEPDLDGQAGNYQPSDYFIEDGSYLRIRSLSLSYEVPERLLKNIGFNALQIYLRGNNVITFSDYSGYSPDIGGGALSSGIDTGVYPVTQAYTLGLNVTL